MYYGAKICFSLHISFIGDILLLNLTYREILVLLVLLHLGRPDMHIRHEGHGVRRGGEVYRLTLLGQGERELMCGHISLQTPRHTSLILHGRPDGC